MAEPEDHLEKSGQDGDQQDVAPESIGGDLIQALPPVGFGGGLHHGHVLEDIEAQGMALGGDHGFRGPAVGLGQDLLAVAHPMDGLGVPAPDLPDDVGVVLQGLDQHEAPGQPQFLGKREIQLVGQGVDLFFHVPGKQGLGRADPGPPGADRGVQEIGEAPARGGHGGHHRHAQQPREFGGVDDDALAGGLVHHVQGHHQGALQAHELQGEFQAAAQEGGVDDIDDDVGFPRQQVVAGFQFRRVGGGEGIDPGQVHAGEFFSFKHHLADGIFHRGAGKIGDRGLVAAKIVENGALTAIGLADEGNNHR